MARPFLAVFFFLFLAAGGCGLRRPGKSRAAVQATASDSIQKGPSTTETPRFLRLSYAYQKFSSGIQISRDELHRRLVPDDDAGREAPSGEHRGSEPNPDRTPGNLLARIWSVFGPPYEGKPDEQFIYTFLDTKTQVVFEVSSWEAGGPDYELHGTYDGALPPPPEPDAHFRPPEGFLDLDPEVQRLLHPRSPEDQALRSSLDPAVRERLSRALKKEFDPVLAFEEFLAPVKLADCALFVDTDFGLYRFGAKQGRALLERVSFADAIDFYIDLVKRYGPKRDHPILSLAEPQKQIRRLWLAASDADRKLRPDALEYAQRAWQDDFEQLPKTIVLNDVAQRAWSESWSTLDETCALLGMNTPPILKELDRLRKPPPVPKLTDAERKALESALKNKRASRHWSEAVAQQRAESARAFALEHPELAPARIVDRLAASRSAEERHLAELLRDALRP